MEEGIPVQAARSPLSRIRGHRTQLGSPDLPEKRDLRRVGKTGKHERQKCNKNIMKLTIQFFLFSFLISPAPIICDNFREFFGLENKHLNFPRDNLR